MTAHKLRINDRLDPNTYATSRNDNRPGPVSNGHVLDVNRPAHHDQTAIQMKTNVDEVSPERHLRHSSTSSNYSAHSDSSCSVPDVPSVVPRERPQNLSNHGDEERTRWKSNLVSSQITNDLHCFCKHYGFEITHNHSSSIKFASLWHFNLWLK